MAFTEADFLAAEKKLKTATTAMGELRKILGRRHKGNAQTLTRLDIGLNAPTLQFFSPDWAFINHMKKCGYPAGHPIRTSGGMSSVWNLSPATPVPTFDTDGYPTTLAASQSVETVIQAEQEFPTYTEHQPGGVYVCKFDGAGTLDFPSGAISGAVLVSAGRYEFTMLAPPQAVDGIRVRILTTTPGNYVKNIRVFEKQYESLFNAGQVTHPDFINRVKGFNPLRYMNAMQTNIEASEPAPPAAYGTWADRAQTSWASWGTGAVPTEGGRGIPWEAICDISNETGTDPWVCLPYTSTDDYITQAASLVAGRLNSGRNVWVEYGNEGWNGFFKQFLHMDAQAAAQGIPEPNRVYKYQTKRTVEIINAFKAAISPSTRVKGVINTQWSPLPGLEQGLDYVVNGTPAGRQIEYFSIAPYLQTWTTLLYPAIVSTNDQLLNYFKTTNLTQWREWTTNSKTVADKYAQKFIMYEGGGALIGQDNPERDFFFGYARSQQMYDTYRLYADEWKNAYGGTYFMEFVFCGKWTNFGSYGALEYLNQNFRQGQSDTAHKYRACLDIGGLSHPT